MIIFLVFAIVSTVLASNCWIEYGALLAAPWETTPMITIDTNYTQVFNACEIATGGIYEIKYEINNAIDIRMYYELSQSIDSSYVRKSEVCNGTCVSGNIYVCCKDFEHKFVIVTMENLNKNSSVIMQSLSIRYAQEWATISSLIGFILMCTSIGIFLLLYIGCACGCVLCIMCKRKLL